MPVFDKPVQDGDKIIARIDDTFINAPVEIAVVVVPPKQVVSSLEFIALDDGIDLEKGLNRRDSFKVRVTFKRESKDKKISIDVRVKDKEKISTTVRFVAHQSMEDPLVFETKPIVLNSDMRFEDVIPGSNIEARYIDLWPWDKGTSIAVTGRSTAEVLVRSTSKLNLNYGVVVRGDNDSNYFLRTKTNQPFDLEPGSYFLQIEYPITFNQSLKVFADQKICIQVPSNYFGEIQIGRSEKPGIVEAAFPQISSSQPQKKDIESWCDDIGPKPGNWENGQWGKRIGLSERDNKNFVYEFPVGEYVLDSTDKNLYPDNTTSFKVVAGQQTDLVVKLGRVSYAALDYKGNTLPGNSRIVAPNGNSEVGSISLATISIPVRKNRYSVGLNFGQVSMMSTVNVTHGCACDKTFNTGRVWFDKGHETEISRGVSILPGYRSPRVTINTITTGSYLDLPEGKYSYQYADSSKDRIKHFTVASGTEQRIKPDNPLYDLSIIWPKILFQHNRADSWEFKFKVTDLSEKEIKYKFNSSKSKPVLSMEAGSYLLHISDDSDYGTDLMEQVIPVTISNNNNNKINIQFSTMIFNPPKSKTANYRIWKSGKNIREIYQSNLNRRWFIYLKPGTYKMENIDTGRKWVVNIKADEIINFE